MEQKQSNIVIHHRSPFEADIREAFKGMSKEEAIKGLDRLAERLEQLRQGKKDTATRV